MEKLNGITVSTNLRANKSADELFSRSKGLVPCALAAVGVVLGDGTSSGRRVRADLGSSVRCLVRGLSLVLLLLAGILLSFY